MSAGAVAGRRPDPGRALLWIKASGPPLIAVLVLQAAHGIAVAARLGDLSPLIVTLTLAYFVPDGIGRRLVNDYEDHARGIDGPASVRPDSALALALDMRAVRRVGMAAWAVAFVIAGSIALLTFPWLLLLGPVLYLAYFLYAGGPWPLGHRAMGEVLDFTVTGTATSLLVVLVNARTLDLPAVVACVGVGLLFTTLMLHNNARDVDKDRLAGKRTLPHVIGRTGVRVLYTVCLAGHYAAVLYFALAVSAPGHLLPLLTLPWAALLLRRVLTAELGEGMPSWSWLYNLMIANLGLFTVGAFL